MPRGGSKPRFTAKEVCKAVKGSGGIKNQVARKLGVNRHTIDNYQRKYASVRRALEQERQNTIDVAEALVVTNIFLARKEQTELERLVDTGDAKWYLARIGKDRGYTERKEADVSLGGKVGDGEVRVVFGWDEDEDEDKEQRENPNDSSPPAA